MPSTSRQQQKFMFAELAKKKAGEKTQTGMSTQQLKDFTHLKKHHKEMGKAIKKLDKK